MKAYRIGLVILLLIVLGCGVWYFYGVFQGSAAPEDGTLVKCCKNLCRSV